MCGFKNASVCTLKTCPCVPAPRARVETCSRGAGIHGDVLNVHTEAFLNPHTGFSAFFFSVPQRTHTKHGHDHNDTHNTTQRWRETEKEDRERERREDGREERQDKKK